MIVPPLARTPVVRLLLVAYPALACLLPAAGRPWLTVPLALTALAATGALWIRALPGPPAETGVPAARPGLTAAAGLITVPLLALLLHAAGRPVRPAPLVIACAALVTVLGAVALIRDHRRAATRPGLPCQRRHDPASPPASIPRHAAGLPADPPPSPFSSYDRTGSPAMRGPGDPSHLSPAAPDPDPHASDLSDDPSATQPIPALDSVPGAAAAGFFGGAASSGVGGFGRATATSGVDHTDGSVPPDGDLVGSGRGPARTAVAVTVPLVLAVGVGGPAVHAYLNAPHPPDPGYLSVALNGWATAIDGPVTVPARGLVVPVRVTSAGLADTTRLLQLRISGQVVASRPMTVAADSVRSLTVYVPALPPDGLLHSVAISVGATSIGFYALGHADNALNPGTTASAAVTGPGVRPADGPGTLPADGA
ncbi:hypothetical protein AB0C31_23550, partial [Actinoplanes philippinensis]